MALLSSGSGWIILFMLVLLSEWPNYNVMGSCAKPEAPVRRMDSIEDVKISMDLINPASNSNISQKKYSDTEPNKSPSLK